MFIAITETFDFITAKYGTSVTNTHLVMILEQSMKKLLIFFSECKHFAVDLLRITRMKLYKVMAKLSIWLCSDNNSGMSTFYFSLKKEYYFNKT